MKQWNDQHHVAEVVGIRGALDQPGVSESIDQRVVIDSSFDVQRVFPRWPVAAAHGGVPEL